MDQTKTSAAPPPSPPKDEVGTPTPKPPKPSATPPSRAKRTLGVVAAIVVILGACYLGGYLHGRAEVARVSAALEAARKDVASHQVQFSERLDASKRRVALLEARRSLDQAITALDSRNFGIAERQIKTAAENLAAARVDAPLSDLEKTLAAFHLTATEDLGPQRKQIVDWIVLLDRQLPTNAQ